MQETQETWVLSAHPPWEHSPVLSWDWGVQGQSPSAEIGGGGLQQTAGFTHPIPGSTHPQVPPPDPGNKINREGLPSSTLCPPTHQEL